MTDTQKNAAVVQAAERLFDFASEQIPQPTPKAAQDFTDPANYWHRAALAALPQPAPLKRDHQIELMTNAEARHKASMARWLSDATVREAVCQPAPEVPSEREDNERAEIIAFIKAQASQYKPDGDMRFTLNNLAELIRQGKHVPATRARKIGGAS